jgi:hypothetical protein
MVVRTHCGRFRLDPDRRIVYVGPYQSPVPRRAFGYFPDTLIWYGFTARRHVHLLVGRGQRQLWRSRGIYEMTDSADVGALVLGRRGVAFSNDEGVMPRLYVARYGHREYPIAGGEVPLTFLRSGELLTRRRRGNAVLLRSGRGRFERVVARSTSYPVVDERRGLAVFRVGTRLLTFDGSLRAVADLRKFGVPQPHQGETQLLGDLIAVRNQRRLVVLRADGSVFASNRLPPRRERSDGVSSEVVANDAGTAVAFTVTGHRTAKSLSHETVYVLAAGARRAQPVYSTRTQFGGCGRWVDLAWHGRWLLYSAVGRVAAVIDTERGRTIPLTRTLAHLPGTTRNGWSGTAWR